MKTALATTLAAITLVACSSSASVEPGDTTLQPTSSAPTATIDTSETGAAARDLPIPSDLFLLMPENEDLRLGWLNGFSGDYLEPTDTLIGIDQTALPWAVGLTGGIDRFYDFQVDTGEGRRRASLTIRALLFESNTEALDAMRARRQQLGDAVVAGVLESGGPAYSVRFKDPSSEFTGVSGTGTVLGPLMIEVVLGDTESRVRWTTETMLILEDFVTAVLTRYPTIKS